MIFQQRPISAPDTLGQRLQQLRDAQGLSLEQLGTKISVAPKYLQAIEEGRYQDLPGLVYARNFVKLYVAAMQLNVDSAMERFEQEYHVMKAVKPSKRPMLPQRAITEFPFVRRYAKLLTAGLAVLLVAGYLGWQVVHLLTPPELVITDPAQDVTITVSTITVKGQTDPEASVSINSQSVEVRGDGSFSDPIDLQPGVNALLITASKKHSRDRVVLRHVLVEAATE